MYMQWIRNIYLKLLMNLMMVLAFCSLIFSPLQIMAISPTNWFIVVYGQSLARGSGGVPDGIAVGCGAAYPTDNLASSVVAGDGPLPTPFPVSSFITSQGIVGWSQAVENSEENPRIGFVREFCDDHDGGVTALGVARGGYQYLALKKGTQSWRILSQGVQAYGASTSNDRSLGMLFWQGEQDEIDGTSQATYKGYLEELQTDFQQLIRSSITQNGLGGTHRDIPVPILVVVETSWTKTHGPTSSGVALAQGKIAFDHQDGTFCLVNPTYYCQFSADGIHADAECYRSMGAKAKRVALGEDSCMGLYPISTTRSGTQITQTFNLGSGRCLEQDTTVVTGISNMGYEYTCGSSPPSISSVSIISCNQVRITLNGTPNGTCDSTEVIRYAYTGTTNASAGRTTGARGQIRDDNPVISADGDRMYSRAPPFSVSVD